MTMTRPQIRVMWAAVILFPILILFGGQYLERQRTTDQICKAIQANRQAILLLVDLGKPIEVPVGADPALVDLINTANRQQEKVQQRAHSLLGQATCS